MINSLDREARFRVYRNQWDKAGQGILNTPYPTDLTIELASICNSQCVFCPITPNHHPKDNLFPSGLMKFELFKKIIDEASGNVHSLKLQYRGESTLHPQWNDFCDYATKANFTEVMVNTNGNYKEIKREGLYKLDKIIFSIDSLNKQTYESIRKNLSFNLLMKNFYHAIEISRKKKEKNRKPLAIKVNMTVTSQNKHEINDIKFLEKLGAEVRTAPVFSRTINSKDYALNLTILGRKNCQYPMQRQIITHQGLVMPCCSEWQCEKSDLILGDVTKESIYAVWHNKVSRQIKKDALEANYTKKSCQKCMVWPSYKIVDQEKLAGLY